MSQPQDSLSDACHSRSGPRFQEFGVKVWARVADNEYMIISDEQVARVLAYVRSGTCGSDDGTCDTDIPPELTERIRSSMAMLPDVRQDRLDQARAHLADGPLDSTDVARKMIARALSDSIR